MSLSLSIAGDFASITDNLKTVTIAGSSVSNCLRRAVTTKEASASGGKHTVSDTVFHVDQAAYTSQPEIGGTITDVDGDWTILSVQWQTFVRRWRCVCRQLAIADIPANRVTIQQASYTKSSTGAEEPTWADVASDVLAMIVLDKSTVDVTHSNRVVGTAAKVMFTASQSLTSASRIVSSTGAVLKVLAWEGFSTIDQYFTASCEVSKWPQS